jgi:DNA-binding beta-propeller fold protein YncE
VVYVFAFLPGQAIGRCECVCSKWRDLIHADKTLQQRKQYAKPRTGVSNTKGKVCPIRQWGTTGTADGQFHAPSGVVVDKTGNILITDTFNCRCQVFSNDGTFLSEWGTRGSGDGQFISPFGVAVDGEVKVVVVDSCNHRIQVFRSDGTFLTKWGKGKGQWSV